jgi:hypothetical protein
MRLLKFVLLFIFCAAIALAETITIPADRIDVAKTKVELINELRASLEEDHKGILNIQRERKIKELAHRLEIQER